MASDDADKHIDPQPPWTQFASMALRDPFSGSIASPLSLASSVQDTGPTGPGQSISPLSSEVAVTLSGKNNDSAPASPTAPKYESSSTLEENPKADRSSDAGAAIQSWRETVRQASFDGGVDVPRGNPGTPRLIPSTPMPIVDSPASIPRSVSIQGSVRSNTSYEELDQEWNAETLFEMTNVVREALKYLRIPNAECEALANILKYMLIDEQTPTEVSLKLISYCRLDKLLEDLHSFRNRMIKENRDSEVSLRFDEVLCRASSLEYKWLQRFKTAYFNLDSERIKDMMKNGSLQGLVLNPMYKGLDVWKVVSKKGFADKEGDLGFHAGKWWLNIQCAFRDGIVGRIDGKATKGKCGVTALPLLTGEEMDGPTLNMTQYTKRGKESEMPFGLLGNRGHPFRVLRGYILKSRYAPEAGVRYDGMYVFKQFSHKLVDEKEDLFECKLILERVTGQGSINEVLLGRSASEMDEWALYLQIVSDHIKSCEGIVACSDWRIEHDIKVKEKQKWCKEVALKAGLQKYVVVPRKAKSGQEQG